MDNLNTEEIQVLVGIGATRSAVQTIPGANIPTVLVPYGYDLKAVPELVYNDHQPAPERRKGNISVLDPASFIEYYNLFSDANSRTFADETKISVLSVLDYHGAKEGAPRWGQHRLTLTLRQSEEWKIWLANNNRQMTQQTFAEFLEQNSLDIIKPSPSAIIDIANDLEGTTEVEFASGQRMSDGQVRFKYTEATKTTVGGGSVDVPDRFTVQIPAFVGGERVPIEALLRFRCKEGKLVFWFTLVRPEEVIRKAFIAARDFIATELGIVVINGVPA